MPFPRERRFPDEVETEGLQAYEQARAFERLGLGRLQIYYVILALIPVFSGLLMWRIGAILWAAFGFLAGAFFLAAAWFHWRNLQARHEKNLELLAKLERKYGDKLPWIEMENHFAAMEQLKRDLAAEKRRQEG